MERRETRSRYREETAKKPAGIAVTISERGRRANARKQRKREQVEEQNVDEPNLENQNIQQNVEEQNVRCVNARKQRIRKQVEEQNADKLKFEKQNIQKNAEEQNMRLVYTRVYTRKQSKRKQVEETNVDETNFEKQNIQQNVEEQNVRRVNARKQSKKKQVEEQNVDELIFEKQNIMQNVEEQNMDKQNMEQNTEEQNLEQNVEVQNVEGHNVEEQHICDDIDTSPSRCNTQTSLGEPQSTDVISNDTPITSSARNDKVYFNTPNGHTDTATNTPRLYSRPPSNGEKYSLMVDFEGAKGKYAGRWSSRCGALIRDHVPIGFKEWRQVDEVYKDKLWKELLKEFEMDINPNLARPILERKFSQYYRTRKAVLRTKYLKKDGRTIPKCDAIANRPINIDKIWWEKFIDNEYSEKKQQQCMRNAVNKSKHTINHTLGRKSYCRLYEEMAMENPEQKLSRATLWKVGHKSKITGEVIPCAAEIYALIEAAEEKRKLEVELNGNNDGVASLEDLENDPVAEVFGPDKGKSWCRAVSSTSSLKRVKLTLATKAIADRNEREELRICKEEIQNQVNDAIKSVTSEFLDMQKNMMQAMKCNIFESDMTPKVASNANHVFFDSPVGNVVASPDEVGSSLRGRQYVSLLSRNLEEVAKGYIGTDGTCHFREVVNNSEKVVWVTEVIDPEAPIFDGPQNGKYKLSDLSDGGCVIWPLYRLRNL